MMKEYQWSKPERAKAAKQLFLIAVLLTGLFPLAWTFLPHSFLWVAIICGVVAVVAWWMLAAGWLSDRREKAGLQSYYEDGMQKMDQQVIMAKAVFGNRTTRRDAKKSQNQKSK